MKLIPNYTVSYKGVFHKAGVPFDIDPKDRAELERHGRVEEDTLSGTEIPEAIQPGIETAAQNKAPKKGGRPRKVSA